MGIFWGVLTQSGGFFVLFLISHGCWWVYCLKPWDPPILDAFTVSIGVGAFTLTEQIAFSLNIKAKAQKSTRSEDYNTLPSEREGAQHYHSTDLPVYGIGRSFETFGWIPPVTVGWGETSGCATLWGL